MAGPKLDRKITLVILFSLSIIIGVLGVMQVLTVFYPGKFVMQTVPSDGEKNVALFREIVIKTDREIRQASVIIPGVEGRVNITGREIRFKPRRCFKPGTTYNVRFRAEALSGDSVFLYSFSFTTMDMENRIWVEVDLSNIHNVTVYRGSKPIRTMLASGGLPGPDTETLLGTFYIKDRGESFFSERFGEGALYWVRITKQYLFHSIPRDREDNVLEEEHRKLGLPASHGCIRLTDEDARWFYENVPHGAMVIIHD